MPQPAPLTLLVPGAVLAGKYRLLRVIGDGARATVWAARNEATTGEVALKLPRKIDPELRRRFQREARAGAAVKHRNILDVYDLAETEAGEPFLVMQLLSGETLGERLGRARRLDPPEAARIARDVAAALVAAHACGVVHRDLQPANVFLHQEPGGGAPVTKVLDLGVAGDASGRDGAEVALSTRIGTPHYMSPEQVSGDADVDPRSDLWSLGVLLFEMLTGVRPFRGARRNDVLAAILEGEIPLPSRYVKPLDEPLDRLVQSCLRRDPDERIGSAAAVVAELDAFLAGCAAPAAASPVGAASILGLSPDSVIHPDFDTEIKTSGTVRMPHPAPPPAPLPARDPFAEALRAASEGAPARSKSRRRKVVVVSGPPTGGRRLQVIFGGVVLGLAGGVALILVFRALPATPPERTSPPSVVAPAKPAAATPTFVEPAPAPAPQAIAPAPAPEPEPAPEPTAVASAAPPVAEAPQRAAAPGGPPPSSTGKRAGARRPPPAAPVEKKPPATEPTTGIYKPSQI